MTFPKKKKVMEGCYSFLLVGENMCYIFEYSLHNVKTYLQKIKNHEKMGWIYIYLVFFKWGLHLGGELIFITVILHFVPRSLV